MPIGIIVNGIAIIVGGLLGALLGNRVPDQFKNGLIMVFGGCAMCMGISAISLMENMPAVILATILGTAIGLAIHLGDKINACGGLMQQGISKILKQKNTGMSESEFKETLTTVIVLFCASGTGIYGSMVSGMTGDHSILLAKSFLDLPTALIFGCTMGLVISAVAIPQMIVFLILFALAGVIYPLTTPTMINDFKACGGLIIFVTGFRMIKVKMFPTADMIPAMILVMPISWLWVTYILPLVS